MTESPPSTGSLRNSWYALALFVMALGIVAAIDRSGHEGVLPGDAVPNAEWSLHLTDVPAAWRALEESSFYEGLRTDPSDPVANGVLNVRQLTGLRLTPRRWSLWFGRKLTAVSLEGELNVVVPAKIVTRLVEPIARRTRGWSRDDTGLVHADDVVYAWRGRHLIVGQSAAAVSTLRNAPVSENEREGLSAPIRWTGPSGGLAEVSVWTTQGFPIQCEVEGEFLQRANPFSFSRVAPYDALVRIHGTNLRPIMDILRNTLDLYAAGSVLERDVDAFTHNVPKDTSDFALVLSDLHARDSVETAVPELFLATRDGGTNAQSRPTGARPIEWEGLNGWNLDPAKGGAIYALFDQSTGYWANGSNSVERNLPWARATDSVDWDHYIDVDWARTAQAAHAGGGDTGTSVSASGLRRYLDTLRHLGRTRLTGRVESGRLTLQGHLAEPASDNPGRANGL